SIRQLQDSVRRLGSNINRLLRRQNFHSKTLGLHYRTPGQIATTEPHWKPKIVLNAGAHSSLAAGRFPLDYYRVQTFRGAINGSGQTGRPSTDNRQIIKASLGASSQSDFLRNVRRDTLKQLRPPWKKNRREIRSLWAQRVQKAFGLRIVGRRLDINPLIRDVITRKKVSQLVRSRRPSCAEHANSLKCRMVGGLPVVEQVVQLRIQMVRGRIPRLQEKIIDAGLIDGADGSVGVGICREQRSLRTRIYPHRLLQKFHAIHARHALVGE